MRLALGLIKYSFWGLAVVLTVMVFLGEIGWMGLIPVPLILLAVRKNEEWVQIWADDTAFQDALREHLENKKNI